MHELLHAVTKGRVQQRLGADHVRHHEFRGPKDRPVDVRLGREVHHGVLAAHQLVDEGGVADVAFHEPQPLVGGHRIEVGPDAGVREYVEHRHLGR